MCKTKVLTIEEDRLQELEMIEKLFHESCRREKPLEDLWREAHKNVIDEITGERYGDLFVVPDHQELIDWIVKQLNSKSKLR